MNRDFCYYVMGEAYLSIFTVLKVNLVSCLSSTSHIYWMFFLYFYSYSGTFKNKEGSDPGLPLFFKQHDEIIKWKQVLLNPLIVTIDIAMTFTCWLLYHSIFITRNCGIGQRNSLKVHLFFHLSFGIFMYHIYVFKHCDKIKQGPGCFFLPFGM